MNKIKIVLIGQSAVGKTALFHRILTNVFVAQPRLAPTVGFGQFRVACHKQTTQVRYLQEDATTDEVVWDIDLWDTKGDTPSALLPLYFRQAHIVLAVHDNTMKSGPAAETVLQHIRERWPVDHQVVVLCQNKCDLPTTIHNTPFHTRMQPWIQMEAYISALSGEQVRQTMLNACQLYITKATQINPSHCTNEAPSGLLNLIAMQVKPLWNLAWYCW